MLEIFHLLLQRRADADVDEVWSREDGVPIRFGHKGEAERMGKLLSERYAISFRVVKIF